MRRKIPSSSPPKDIDPVGIIIIENACDLEEGSTSEEGSMRYRKTETVEFLFVYDAGSFLSSNFKIFLSKKSGSKDESKEGSRILRFLENADIDNMNFYLPPHEMFKSSFPIGFVVYCKKSQILPMSLLPQKGPFASVIPPHRDKLRNFHLKYDLRVPSMELESFDLRSASNSED